MSHGYICAYITDGQCYTHARLGKVFTYTLMWSFVIGNRGEDGPHRGENQRKGGGLGVQ